MALIIGKVLVVFAILQCISFALGHSNTIEFNNVIKHENKHWKRLKKHDGAIRLVGGRSEFEG